MSSVLPENLSLQVYLGDQIIFQSSGGWLYPLFDFEDYLKRHPFDTSKVFVRDKVIGKAAALMLVRLGVGSVEGLIMSELAKDVFSSFKVPHTCITLVPRIDCKTESLLQDVVDIEEAYQILCKRAKRC